MSFLPCTVYLSPIALLTAQWKVALFFLVSGLYDDLRRRSRTPWRTSLSTLCCLVNRTSVQTSLPQLISLPAVHRVAWMDLFIRYNTPPPSSAPLESMFSTGSDILRTKRSFLARSRFGKLVFLEGNFKLLEYK